MHISSTVHEACYVSQILISKITYLKKKIHLKFGLWFQRFLSVAIDVLLAILFPGM